LLLLARSMLVISAGCSLLATNSCTFIYRQRRHFSLLIQIFNQRE
jgi:hypothetical protein